MGAAPAPTCDPVVQMHLEAGREAETERRLAALEAKLDKVIGLLEGGLPPRAATTASQPEVVEDVASS